MPQQNVEKWLVRNGQPVESHNKKVVSKIQQDGSWVMKWADPKTGVEVKRTYATEAEVDAAGNELEADYVAMRQAENQAEAAFQAKWGPQ